MSGPGDPVDLRRVEAERAEAGLVVLGVVAVGVPGREVALVPPPDVHLRPVDGVAGGDPAERGDEVRAHRPAGQRDVRHAAGGLGVEKGDDEAGRGRIREGLP